MKKEKINGQSDALKAIDKMVNKSSVLKQWHKEYEIEKEIIERIIETRKANGITQVELAKLTGIKQSAISRIEKRLHSPQLSTIISIAEALEMKLYLEKKSKKNVQAEVNSILYKTGDKNWDTSNSYNIPFTLKGGVLDGSHAVRVDYGENFFA